MEREIGREQAGDEEEPGEGREKVSAILRHQIEKEVAALLLREGLHVICADSADHDPDGEEVEHGHRRKCGKGRHWNGALGPSRLLAIERGRLNADEGRDRERQDRAEIPADVVLWPPDLHREGRPPLRCEHREVECAASTRNSAVAEEGERARREIEARDSP